MKRNRVHLKKDVRCGDGKFEINKTVFDFEGEIVPLLIHYGRNNNKFRRGDIIRITTLTLNSVFGVFVITTILKMPRHCQSRQTKKYFI